MKYKKLFILLSPLLCCPSLAWAAGGFDLLNTTDMTQDLSIRFLGELFGAVGTLFPGHSKSLLGFMFQTFNTAIISMATIVVAYAAIMSTLNTAHEGDVMGQKFSALWVPIKAVVGVGMVVPTKTGYCIFQIITMWAILQGVGAANQTWGVILDNTAKGASLIPQTYFSKEEKEKANGTITNIFTSAVCKQIYIKAKKKNVTLSFDPENINPQIISSSTAPVLKIGVFADSVNPGNTELCGRYNVDVYANADINPDVATQKDTPYILTGGAQPYPPATDAQMSFLIETFNTLEPYAIDLVNNKTKNWIAPSGIFDKLTEDYLTALSGTRFTLISGRLVPLDMLKPPPVVATNDFLVSMRKAGWLYAGTNYFFLVYPPPGPKNIAMPAANLVIPASSELNMLTMTDIKYILPISKPSGTPLIVAGIPLNAAVNAYMTRANAVSASNLSALINSPNESDSNISKMKSFFQDNCTNMATKVIDQITASPDKNTDPMLAMSTWGTTLMLDMEITLGVFLALTVLMNLLSSANAGGSPIFLAIMTMLMAINPILILILATLWTAGAALAIYLPMLPFMIYLLACVAWFIAVIEAMVAAPLIGVGLTTPSHASDHLGKAAPSILLITSLFLRPTLMLIGLILGARIFSIGYMILQFSFTAALKTNTATITLFGAVLVVVLFVTLCLTLANKSFSMIYVLPDKVLRWIGGQVESFGKDVSQGIKEIKSSSESASGQVSKGMSTVAKIATEALKKQADKEKAKIAKQEVPSKGEIDKMGPSKLISEKTRLEAAIKELGKEIGLDKDGNRSMGPDGKPAAKNELSFGGYTEHKEMRAALAQINQRLANIAGSPATVTGGGMPTPPSTPTPTAPTPTPTDSTPTPPTGSTDGNTGGDGQGNGAP